MNAEVKDFFSKHQEGIDHGSIIRNNNKSNSPKKFLIILLVLIFLVIGIYSIVQVQERKSNNGNDIGSSEIYYLGEIITKEGILITSGDIVTYTHLLETKDGETFLLKSRTIPLNNYSNTTGIIQIIGNIEAFYQTFPLIEVSMIGGESLSIEDQDESIIADDIIPGVYVENAGLYFSPIFFDSYTFVGDPGKEKIVMKNLENDKQTSIDFFSCTDQGNTNCNQLLKTFKDNADKTIISSQGIYFIKLSEVNSRYFQNEDWRGYFINDADPQEVEHIKDLLVFFNKAYIKDIVNLYGMKTCVGSNKTLGTIYDQSIKKNGETLEITLWGSGDENFECTVSLDPTLPNKLKFIDIKTIEAGERDHKDTNQENSDSKKEEDDKESSNKENSQSQTGAIITHDTQWNPDVTQFPLNLEKALLYQSSRGGYKMSFPSSNISFSTLNKDQNFDQLGVQCNYGIHVIKFSDKEQLESNPAIIVYECSVKNDFTLPGEQYFLKELGEKKFVIHVRDGAWLDFARNIEINTLE